MGIERESLLRLEREAQRRMTPEKQQQYADALGIPVEQLWRPPGTPSLDETTAEISPELREIITDFVQSVVARRRR